MKTMLFVLLSSLLVLGSVPAAGAQAVAAAPGEAKTFTLPIVDYAEGINKPCSEDTKTIFKLTVEIAPNTDGTFVDGDKGFGILIMKSGQSNVESDYPVFLTNDFFWFGGRKAKIDKTSTLDSVTVEVPGENVPVVVGELERDCVEQLKGEQD